ncbi:hypothetical protein MPSEU_000291700 [Mayamaea pseudoterrestris]|nr:hypothetical protein MPSEU_000291700 [Mayamaea pseudoterrestris]
MRMTYIRDVVTILQISALLLLSCCLKSCQAFVVNHRIRCNQQLRPTMSSNTAYFPRHSFQNVHLQEIKGFGAYIPQTGEEDPVLAAKQLKRFYPTAGDIVKYYDLDGGKTDGQWFLGKISFIQRNIGNEGSGWTLDIAELEDLGDGFFADYSARQRASKKTTRDLASVSPVTASFVRAENAFKIPRDPAGVPKPKVERYDIEGYEGPFSGINAINQDVVEQDALIYDALKSKLFRYAALAGLAGTLVADLVKGTEDAVIYAAGAAASLGYLFLLSVKTDTIASDKAGLGKNIASFRFVLPLVVVGAVAWYNANLGDASLVNGHGLLEFVTPEQFGAATLGFLTYRVPLFLTQIGDALRDTSDGESLLPGSAGIALSLVKEARESQGAASANANLATDETDLPTVLLVSGPQATGRPKLVQRLIQEGNGRFVAPRPVDKVADPANFDRLLQRDEFLILDSSGRYGTTKEGILQSARATGPDSVVVIDADVPLVKQLVKISGLRLVSVWVGLKDLESFKKRMVLDDDIPEGETAESLMRARTREIVQEIEYGISCGIFEFTILNEDEDESLVQLQEAAAFCFK